MSLFAIRINSSDHVSQQCAYCACLTYDYTNDELHAEGEREREKKVVFIHIFSN